MLKAKPDGYDNKGASIFGAVCFWLLSPMLFLELGIFALIGSKWPPLGMFVSEGTKEFDYADWVNGTDYFINPLTKAKMSVPCFGKGGGAKEGDTMPLV